jgi:hypothetical protein
LGTFKFGVIFYNRPIKEPSFLKALSVAVKKMLHVDMTVTNIEELNTKRPTLVFFLDPTKPLQSYG